MDIYLFSFIIFAFACLSILSLVALAHYHEDLDRARCYLEDVEEANDSTEQQLRSDLQSTKVFWQAKYKARTNRLNNANDEIKNLEREIRKLQNERLACVTCTPTLKERA